MEITEPRLKDGRDCSCGIKPDTVSDLYHVLFEADVEERCWSGTYSVDEALEGSGCWFEVHASRVQENNTATNSNSYILQSHLHMIIER